MNTRDDRAGYGFHKGFSEGVPYPRLRATKENFLYGNKKQERVDVIHEFSGLYPTAPSNFNTDFEPEIGVMFRFIAFVLVYLVTFVTEAATVQVTLVDGLSGTPLTKKRVALERVGVKRKARNISAKKTDQAGQVVFEVDTGPDQLLQVVTRSFGTWAISAPFTAPRQFTFKEGTLAVTLVDGSDGSPLANWRIWVARRGSDNKWSRVLRGFTDDQGHIRFTPPGLGDGASFRLQAKSPADGKMMYSQTFTQPGTQTFTLGNNGSGDTNPPVVTLRSTTSGNRTTNGFLVYGTATDDTQVVRVTGRLATAAGKMLLQRDLDVSANDAWAFMIPPGQLQAGDEAVVTIEAEDDEGQVTTEVLNFPVVDPADGILHKLSRVTFGVTPELLEEVRDIGWDAYLQQQLYPETIDDSEAEQGAPSLPLPKAGPWLQDYPLYWIFHSKRHLNEVMAWFWENHFNTSKGKTFAGLEERENQAFRENALGKFRDILEISAKSPAMIQYLDTQHSKRGAINENYARELMELHTLGVGGGYTHEDIVNVARAFTGWYFSPREGGFVFVPAWHDTDPKVVLGHELPNLPGEEGIKDGEAVLDILASHPATARRICTKLARVFISDQPRAATIDDCAAVFQNTDGDMRQVVENLLTSAEFHEASRFHAKFKTPLEYLTSAVRALQPVQIGERDLIGSLANMEQQLFYQHRPTGWAETADKWLDSSQMVQRFRFANQLALRTPRPNKPQNTYLKPVEYFSGLGLETTEGIVGHLFQILTAGDYTQAEWDTAVTYLQPEAASPPFSLQQDDADRKLREMIFFILSLPGAQLQ